MTRHAAVPFALPDVGQAEIAAVTAAIRSGWLSSGPRMREFEQQFADYLGGDVEAIAVNSATAGLHLALEACGIGPGDDVLIPTWTFTATAEVVRYLGATPILVDVEPDTLNIDFGDASSRITSRTRAVIPVHFAGQPIAPTTLRDFAHSHDLLVVEDAAHAFPAARDGELVGVGNSNAVVFSFYATKTMTTMGEGGMLVTTDSGLARRSRVMRLHGMDRDAFARYRSNAPSWRYEVVDAGFKYNLSDPAAAMGMVQLARASKMRDRRAEIARRYDTELDGIGLELPSGSRLHGHHAWHLYVVRMAARIGRDEFVQRLSDQGVGTSVHFIPLHMHPYWRQFIGAETRGLPVATREFERVVSLPIYSAMRDEDVSRVIRAVRRALGC